MKLSQRFVPCNILLLALLSGSAKAQTSSERPQITFVQITDAHLFDDDESANFSALAWAISKINRLVAAGTPVDFVVFTGDLGLRSVSFPPGLCKVAPLESEKVSGQRSLEYAVDHLGEELDPLTVRKLYFLPGNNDLAEEQLGDIGRYQCFLSELQAQLNKRAKGNALSFHPLEVAALEADGVAVAGGIRLLGLNSASLKNQQNYQPWCPPKTETAAPSSIERACPQAQVERLSRSLRAGAPAIVFTHIPYLKDPFPPRAKELPGAWDIPQTLRSEWEQAACKDSVIAIFAGHFHDSNRDLYGARGRQALQVTECTSKKSWIAPPLAQKHQEGQAVQARGLLVASITSSHVTGCAIYWLNSANGSVNDDSVSSCQ
jgi:hypothetical protein